MREGRQTEAFPLPLSPFELFTLEDDCRDYPMCFFIEQHYSGAVNTDALNAALAEAIQMHPLLNCHLQWRRRKAFWVRSPIPPVAKLVSENERLVSDHDGYIDLTNETGLRIWIEQKSNGLRSVFQFHHACCDGIGALQFVTDVAVAYAARTSNDYIPQRNVTDLSLLTTRHHQLNRREIISPPTFPQIVIGTIREVVKFFRQKPMPLKLPLSSPQQLSSDLPNIQSRVLDRQTTRGLRTATKVHGTVLNDILLRDLLLALNKWNAGLPGKSRGKHIRILMPTSLRAEGDQRVPAANILGYTFITRHPKQLESPDELLKSIHFDTTAIHRYKLGWMFVDGVARYQSIKKFLPFVDRMVSKGCFATAILSHMGNAVNQLSSRLETEDRRIKVGNLILESMLSTPPVRQQTRAAFATYTFNGQLNINLRCDPLTFSVADTNQLLDLFCEQLQMTAEGRTTGQ